MQKSSLPTMYKYLAILYTMLPASEVQSQKYAGIEQYYYTGASQPQIVPRIYLENEKNIFGEIRYNYEALNTFSLNMGKTISIAKNNAITLTPFGGMVLGGMNGGNVGSNFNVEYQGLFFSAENQYTFSIAEKDQNFFYNWTEMGYQLSNFWFAGLALQYTKPFEVEQSWEPGVMMGLTYKNWTFPLYAFNPANSTRNFVLGINWEWNKKMKEQNSID